MIDTLLLQAITHRQTGLAAAYDNGAVIWG
jgi:hypothetical protein